MTQVNKNEDLNRYLTKQPPKPKPLPEPKEGSRHRDRKFQEHFSR
jgi:hypothetical protein